MLGSKVYERQDCKSDGVSTITRPGKCFCENEFVNESQIHPIVPNDTFELFLGIDESIKVERKMVNKYTESKGFLGGKKKVTYEFEIVVTNTKQSRETIDVIDQFPISQNEKIKIELIEPDEKEVKIDNQNKIRWRLRLKPGEAKKLNLAYKIEFPSDMQVPGLD